jgi:hypothetical protein
MRDQADLFTRAADAKQSLLLALKQTNAAALDGSRDQPDIEALTRALELSRTARDQLDLLLKRLTFHVALEQVVNGTVNDETSRGMISLVRLGVDGGYDVTEVRRMVDVALGRA